jgi:hypothetical protein
MKVPMIRNFALYSVNEAGIDFPVHKATGCDTHGGASSTTADTLSIVAIGRQIQTGRSRTNQDTTPAKIPTSTPPPTKTNARDAEFTIGK